MAFVYILLSVVASVTHSIVFCHRTPLTSLLYDEMVVWLCKIKVIFVDVYLYFSYFGYLLRAVARCTNNIRAEVVAVWAKMSFFSLSRPSECLILLVL